MLICSKINIKYNFKKNKKLMGIKKLEKTNLKNAINLVWSVFEEFEVPEYSEEGIEEFKKFISYDYIIEKFDKNEINFWGYFDNEKLVGVIATKEINHICLLFIDKEYHRRGIARNLCKIVKDMCENKGNISCITVNSSPYAMEFYKKIGFYHTGEEQTLNGIRFIPMSFSV